MSRQNLYNPIKTAIDSIFSLDYQAFKSNPGNHQPWNNLDTNDFFDSFEDLTATLRSVVENNVLDRLPFNVLNALPGNLTNVYNSFQQLFTQKNQNVFNNAFQQMEGLRLTLMTWGIIYLAQVGKKLFDKEELIDQQVTKLLTSNMEIDTIKENVEKLIEPAVAGSLSKSFSDRKDALAIKQNRWFWVSVVTAFISMIATYWVVTSIVGVFSNDLVIEAMKDSAQGSEKILWPTIFLRVGILFPIFALFSFSFSQYKKERDLEEEYAHKAAVATSLPNYGNLAVDKTVKDQILSEASKIIFTSPIHTKLERNSKKKDSADQTNEMLSSIQKIISKSAG